MISLFDMSMHVRKNHNQSALGMLPKHRKITGFSSLRHGAKTKIGDKNITLYDVMAEEAWNLGVNFLTAKV
jgi:hypothetical protein